MNILTANLLFSTLVFWIAAKVYLLPRLQDLKPRTVLVTCSWVLRTGYLRSGFLLYW
jgi:hypothetical protein